jgi:TolB-like protein
MTTGLLAALGVSALAILPALNRADDAPDRPVAGEAGSIRELEVDAAARAAARAALKGRERIAVWISSATKKDAGTELDALGCTEAMIGDLRYAPGFLVLERQEVEAARRGLEDPEDLGRKLGARWLVIGTVTRAGGDSQLDAALVSGDPVPAATDGEPAGARATATATRPGGKVYELADAVLLDLLAQRKATPPPDRVAEMTRIPTLNDSARALCDAGFALLDRAGGKSRDDDRSLSIRALKHAEAALKADPQYLRAALLQASCLMSLGEAARLEACLGGAAGALGSSDRIDALTRLEVEGDHAALVKHDPATAAARYETMLEIDPGHLRALWMLAALHAGEFEPPDWPGSSRAKAREYAARLIAAHPDSSSARFLAKDP